MKNVLYCFDTFAHLAVIKSVCLVNHAHFEGLLVMLLIESGAKHTETRSAKKSARVHLHRLRFRPFRCPFSLSHSLMQERLTLPPQF